MSTKVDKLVKTYKVLSSIPALVRAEIESENVVSSVWSQRNIEKGKATKFNRMHFLFPKTSEETLPIDISAELLTRTSPSRKYKAVLRENDSKQFLEIWQHHSILRTVDLSSLDIHGNIYTDAEFCTFDFSPDEKRLLYIAEKKNPKNEPFYKRKAPEEAKSNGGDTAKKAIKGEEFLYQQDWGEQLVGKRKSIIAEYNIENDTVQLLEGIPDNVCVAQAKYSPDGMYIVGVVYFIEPRKLGLIYCTNRPSSIFYLNSKGDYFTLSLNNKSVKSPIFSPDGKYLVWLQRNSGGPHMSCMKLVKINVPFNTDSNVETVVDIVPETTVINNNKLFYGIYNSGFPKRPWASNNRLVFNTNQKYTINSYIVNIDSGEITELEGANGSRIVVDVNNDTILSLERNFLKPDVLSIGQLKSDNSVDWKEIHNKLDVPELSNMTYKYFDLVAPEGSVTNFNAIYLGPNRGENKTVPLIVWPHGGPHSAFANYFFLEAAMFLSLGYAIVLINYRGSIGSGDDSVNYLLGKVGTSDVKDCIQAVDTVLEEFAWLNPDQLVLCGGSHGGFLVTHLSGQYPDKFKAVVARNPVIDIASMSIISDIPDWCYVEAGEAYTQIGEPDDSILLKMRNASPIMHAHKVKAPTLLQIGSKDLRVPPHQGTDYYNRLKSNGVTVRMNLYDDNHPLGTVPNEIDNILNTILWFETHLKREE
ncbi:acylamino-acid-releasing enzyme-like isoform X2 [Rhynchophorus ferrugineus]|uniref:acylamino-acid-releasing enzyme-like isoform X2 n=1 Tax=Rhynchophorus ferrugineus TaxID=354439 RepID=UPI003FCC2DEF